MEDPFGAVLVAIRDDPGVAALVSDRVSANVEEPPAIRLQAGAPTSLAPFGPSSNNVGVQRWIGLAKCYAPNNPSGPQTARAIAGAVVDALHGLHARRHGSGLLIRVWTPQVGEIQRDPDTEWPYHVVRIEAYAAAQAVT